ncbi:MAG TPA: hypothetical protein VGQ35_06120 [Dongiaceae bacterium]|nr:hypothetical protein [Dongiaceae bacterium]
MSYSSGTSTAASSSERISGEMPSTLHDGGMLAMAAGSMKMLLVVTGPMVRTLCRTPTGIHTPCAGGTTQAPCSVHTTMTPVAP